MMLSSPQSGGRHGRRQHPTLYWVTGTIDSSLQVYREWGLGVAPEHLEDLYPATPPGVEPRPLPAGQRIEVPVGIAVCNVRYPRRFVERAYADIRQWSELPKRGTLPRPGAATCARRGHPKVLPAPPLS
jgi:hypothetical protein